MDHIEDDALCAAVGGPAGMRTAVDILYRRMLDDSSLAHRFTGADVSRLVAHQRAFLTAAVGGPDLYSGRDLGAAHSRLDLTDAEFDALCEHLAAVLRDLGAPASAAAEAVDRLQRLRPAVLRAPVDEGPRKGVEDSGGDGPGV
ncbi:group 1 truncated hemoglobin [Actinomadura sp. K4S16]|uniref:group I truncated hemoglobin n=1 Tax=Actinomadura sp. K4S16 TaxID=1316147 RepID=UPI0011EF5F6F|nr:group 1 truncated hemoglobin [Actinomadura sp. K4S16]